MKQLVSVWTRHEPELRGWLRARTPVASEAEDILQDSFIKALRQGDRFRGVEQPRAWLFEITRNTLIDRLRAHKPLAPMPPDWEEIPDEPAQLETVDALVACLPRVLSELDARDREAIELCDLQGLPQAEFARLKGLTLPAAKSRVQRARQRMRESMALGCQVSFDPGGRVADFVPRPALATATPDPTSAARASPIPCNTP
ncbi:sigma-70 family RNA polymerase sigma factor [Hydrogenophaga sp. D2P1]|uniref:RNA polymerase sigma factor n=1 Tax=Hydrogenophaga aromaticivorans TaxID=2610898 RepID=A0A7Y8GTL6_9BURK|nr:sigma-70 family RNA polymerase sigma factor [Hydrogenophaga aromaticivorans]NWF44629.1 sigma-70 family RNA polymerase sigma factor [Hydrogenophaga aromaticivorans]